VVCLGPRVPGEIVGPRPLSRVVVRPLNFTVRRRRRKNCAVAELSGDWPSDIAERSENSVDPFVQRPRHARARQVRGGIF
jgi:hypothetical protein